MVNGIRIYMNLIKKYWYIFTLLVVTFGLGIVTFLTSQKLTKTTSIAPTVPQVTPKAVTPACTYTFTITLSAKTASPTSTVAPTGTLTQKTTPTVTSKPTPLASRTPTPTVTSTPTQTPSLAPTATSIPPGICNTSCNVSTDCAAGYTCSSGTCRNPSCTLKTSCVCDISTLTPTPTNASIANAATPTEVPQPAIPVSGGETTLGALIISFGALLLIVGFAL
jgi:hypothetical protein